MSNGRCSRYRAHARRRIISQRWGWGFVLSVVVAVPVGVAFGQQAERGQRQRPAERAAEDQSKPRDQRDRSERDREGRDREGAREERRRDGTERRAEREQGRAVKGLWERMTPEERESVRGFVGEKFPELHDELEGLRRRDATEYDRRMQEFAPEMRRIMDELEVDPDRGQLSVDELSTDIQMQSMVNRYHQAKDRGRRGELKGRIRELAGKLFDIQQRKRRMEISDLEKQMERVRQRIDADEAERDRIIDGAVEDRLREPAPVMPVEP